MSSARATPAIESNRRQPAPEIGPRAQRTIDAILTATREVFRERGYAGTSVDDITSRAGVSRASFYTYFATKRDALVALGSDASKAAQDAIAHLDDLPSEWTVDDLERWLRDNFSYLDEFGAFGLAWGQAVDADDELRAAGMHGHLRVTAELGRRLNALRGEPLGDDAELGLVVLSMLERAWSYRSLYHDGLDVDTVVTTAAAVLAALLTP